MKKYLIFGLIAVHSSVYAVDIKPYLEGQIGYYGVSDVDTETWTGTYTKSGNTLTRASGKIDYDNTWGAGVELGLRDVGIENLRVAVSYQRANFDMKKITGSFTVNNVIRTGDITNLANSLGNFDNRVNLYMLNAYYDFKNTSAFTPFLGVGIGIADVRNTEDNEFSYSLTGGAKYYFDKNIYLGVKATYTSVNGVTDKLGIKYEDIHAYSGHALLGYEF